METAVKMNPFFFSGKISSSKSLMNRALITQSLNPDLQISGYSNCDDVVLMKKAVEEFPNHTEIECGDAGTVLRFMSVRASREKGYFRLKGSNRLFQRPQGDLLFLLEQLQVKTELLPNELIIESEGWRKPIVPIRIHREKSSQFSTGLLLSCWNLPFPIEFELTPVGLKDSYWNMSVQFVENLGMKIEKKAKDCFLVPAEQKVKVISVEVEPDYSSVFAVAVAAALLGEARIENVRVSSIQPDFGFIKILKNMKVPILLEKSNLGILKAPRISPIDISLSEMPDLFPVLAVLCAFANGQSKISGAPRLVFKESNRIQKSSELLKLMGVKNKILSDGIIIEGKGSELSPRSFDFDPDQDHRMAMAAGVLMRAGWDIQLKNPEVVKKSFPEFWDIMGIEP